MTGEFYGCCNGTCSEDCPIRLMGEQSGETKSGYMKADQQRKASRGKGGYGDGMPDSASRAGTFGDSGSAARFFPNFDADPFLYCPKASRKDRNAGCEGMEEKAQHRYANGDGFAGRTMNSDGEWVNTDHASRKASANHHPCVKPTALCEWLVRLSTPPGGIVLDPFMGSGSIGVGAIREGMGFVGIEREEEYLKIAQARIASASEALLVTPYSQAVLPGCGTTDRA